MAASGGAIWAPAALRALRHGLGTTTKLLRQKFVSATTHSTIQSATLKTAAPHAARQPLHPAALRRQLRARWLSATTHPYAQTARRWLATTYPEALGRPTARGAVDRARLPASATSARVARLTGRAPFAGTLRPNLTGGALPRTAGGYGLGLGGRAGGPRYFSHGPAAPAEVVQSVGQAVRAFVLGGQRAQFDGVDGRGRHRFRAVGVLEAEAGSKVASAPKLAPGAFVDFKLSPTVTALSPLAAAFPYPSKAEAARLGLDDEVVGAVTLGSEGLLDDLSGDLSRAMKELTAVMGDLNRLAALGDLPVVLHKANVIRVRFPGVDADTVEILCGDIGIQRGVVGQDPEFEDSPAVEMALRFPFAPDSGGTKSLTSPGRSLRSHGSLLTVDHEVLMEEFMDVEDQSWLSSPEPEGYGTMSRSSGEHCSTDFEGLEGIYRFLEECDRAKDQF